MPTSYSDIKRYNLNPDFLFQTARKVINYPGWDIQQETEGKINALISKESGSLASRINVIIHKGYIALDFECDSEITLIDYFENQTRVKQFI